MTLSYFEEIEKQIISKISSSKSNIFVAVAWFTNQLLFDSLTDAIKNNVAVKVLILDDILNRNEFGLDFGALLKLGAEVRFAKSNEGTMHNKFCIIDDLVITGSYNWTYHANKNRENILMTDEESVVSSYKEEFDRLFGGASPIAQPYEHLKWMDVKEGDFSELRRSIFRDVIAKNDDNRELKRIKLINLDHAYRSGDAKELAKASSLVTEQHLRTITDVLTSSQKRYVGELYYTMYWDWDEEPADVRFSTIDKWIFVPEKVGENNNHEKYVRCYAYMYNKMKMMILSKTVRIDVYDNAFISSIDKYLEGDDISRIPDSLICINFAKLFLFRLPSNVKDRVKHGNAIAAFCMAKEVNGSKIVYYEGWDPQTRKEKILRDLCRK